MNIGFYGDSFCHDIENNHSRENNYQTYIQKIAQKYNAKITSTGEGGSSVWDLVLLQWKHIDTLPDVCVFTWTLPVRLFHKDYRFLSPATINNNNITKLPSKLADSVINYYNYLYDEDKHYLEYQSLLYYFDNVILSKYPDTKFIHLWSFHPTYYKDGSTVYPHTWKNGVEIFPSLDEPTRREMGENFPSLDKRANHIDGERYNQLLCDSISKVIDNYPSTTIQNWIETKLDTVTKLNFKLDINELRQYYNKLNTDYQHLDWSWEKCGNDIVKQWRDAAYQDPANLLTHGWAIQSNLKDITIPCPPWNISKHETVAYRNTELAFGIISRLQDKIPFGYRWSVSVQPPGGKVSIHTDAKDEYTVWLPIHTCGPAITFDKEYELVADGSAYLLNTTQPHHTFNSSNEDRVTIIFRLKQDKLNDLLSLQGTI